MKYLFTILISTIGLAAFGQNWNQMIKTVASDRATNDKFGNSVSVDGNTAVVCSYTDLASAYVFELNNGVWTETAELFASDSSAGTRFGYSVCISGDRIIIGAFTEAEDAMGSATIIEAGAAYIFERNGGIWTETAKLVASDRTTNDRFGIDVSISGDKAIVGAYRNDGDELGANPISDAGAAYIFELIGGVWTETAKVVGSDRENVDWFGYCVGISGDKAIVGAYRHNLDASGGSGFAESGAVYVYEQNGGTWSQTSKLVASDRSSLDHFGWSIYISGNRVIVGARDEDNGASGGNNMSNAGSAYIYELSGGVWSETTKIVASDRASDDQFGFSVCINQDRAIVGSRLQDEDVSGGATQTDAGAAYVFELNGGVWSETSKLVASDRSSGDNFGRAVSISGNKALVGAYLEDNNVTGGDSLADAGSAYFYITCPSLPTVNVSGNFLTTTTSGTTYQWIDCDNGNAIIPNETNQSYTATVNGNYAVVVSALNCTDTSACASVTQVGINEQNLAVQAIRLFPNPATSQLTIQAGGEIESITITDLLGKTVQTIAKPEPTIDVTHLMNGIYLLQIRTERVLISKKFIKE